MKIAIGTDSYGLPLKDSIKEYLINNDYEIEDYGVKDTSDPTPYYETANKIAQCISNGKFERAILICGTGMGMSIIANKHSGIYAAVCESTFAAEKSRSINNSNILTLGSMITTEVVARDIVDVWLKTKFTEGWDSSMQDWLKSSMDDITSLERKQFMGQ